MIIKINHSLGNNESLTYLCGSFSFLTIQRENNDEDSFIRF
jgi:hypothetical protein